MKRTGLQRRAPLERRIPPRGNRRNTLKAVDREAIYEYGADGYTQAVCWLAQFAPSTACEGTLRRAHLISKQRIKRALRNSTAGIIAAERELTVFDVLWDSRVWVPACDRHHGMLDVSRTLRVPREAIPAVTEQYAREFGLTGYLDLEFGEPLGAA